MKEDNLLRQIVSALEKILGSPEKTLEKIQLEEWIIKPLKNLSMEGKIVGELTPALSLLYHYWRDSGNKAEFIKAQAVSQNSKGGNTDNIEAEYVKMRMLEELARTGFWVVVNEEFDAWNIDNLVVGQVDGRPVIVEKRISKKESHEGMMISVGTGSPGGMLRALQEVLGSDCDNPNCLIHHPENRSKEKEETEN